MNFCNQMPDWRVHRILVHGTDISEGNACKIMASSSIQERYTVANKAGLMLQGRAHGRERFSLISRLQSPFGGNLQRLTSY
jgi:hypothetical protein